MRILLVSARYLPHRGGLESVVQHLAREFCRRGHEVQIVTNCYPRSLPATEMIDGLKVRRLHFLLPELKYLKNFRFHLWLAGWWYRVFTLRALRTMIQDFRPDVINNHYLNEAAELSGRCLSRYFPLTPWVISFHGGDVDGEPYLDHANRRRFQVFARQAQRLTACSAFLASRATALDQHLCEKIDVIHNGVDVSLFSIAGPTQSDHRYILAVGQLVQHKGFDLLIRAFAVLTEKYPTVELWIAGEGSYRPSLEDLITERRLNERVRLLGKTDEQTVASLMASALFVAMPSRREPFGIVALEAMAAGKAVLGTPVGGLPEFLPCPPNGLATPQLSVWTMTLDKWLAQAEDQPLKADGNLEAARKLDWSFVADRYLQTYKRAQGYV